MTITYNYGPVELFLIGYENEIDPHALDALAEVTKTGVISLLDLVILRKELDGSISVTEVADRAEEFGFDPLSGDTVGLAGDEDIQDMAQDLPAGSSAVIVALEQTYMRDLAYKLHSGGGEVLPYERVPANVVNEVADLDPAS